jgi:hypothetical protein
MADTRGRCCLISAFEMIFHFTRVRLNMGEKTQYKIRVLFEELSAVNI